MIMNKDLLNKFFIFAMGAGIGSLVTWKLLEVKFEQKIKEENELTREYYSKRDSELVVESDIPDEYYEKEENVDEKKEYENMVGKLDYVKYSNTNTANKEDEYVEKPYVIPPEDFGDFDEYEQEELTYYTDGVVADDFGNIVEDIDETIGADFADHYGEYEEDSVYIRNDAKQTEYAILRDYRKYSEVYPTEDK